LKNKLFLSVWLRCNGTNTSLKQQCYKLAASDMSSTYLMSCSSSSSSSADIITTMTAPATIATTTGSSASDSYNDVWSIINPITVTSHRVSGRNSNRNNYEMELLLSDIHISLNIVKKKFNLTVSIAVNNNHCISLSSLVKLPLSHLLSLLRILLYHY
jgi:hypothetical protein